MSTPKSLLEQLTAAQRTAALALSAAHIEHVAEELNAYAHELSFPVLVPVSEMAERLVGAALACTHAPIEAVSDTAAPKGRRVLLVEAAAVTDLHLARCADVMERQGAHVVGSFAIEVQEPPRVPLRQSRCWSTSVEAALPQRLEGPVAATLEVPSVLHPAL